MARSASALASQVSSLADNAAGERISASRSCAVSKVCGFAFLVVSSSAEMASPSQENASAKPLDVE